MHSLFDRQVSSQEGQNVDEKDSPIWSNTKADLIKLSSEPPFSDFLCDLRLETKYSYDCQESKQRDLQPSGCQPLSLARGRSATDSCIFNKVPPYSCLEVDEGNLQPNASHLLPLRRQATYPETSNKVPFLPHLCNNSQKDGQKCILPFTNKSDLTDSFHRIPYGPPPNLTRALKCPPAIYEYLQNIRENIHPSFYA